jgi:hypothetical protein
MSKHSSSSGSVKKPTPPIKVKKARTKVAVTAASSRPTRTFKAPTRLIDPPMSHPAVKKPAPKKTAPKKAAASKKAAAKKPPAKKTAPKKTMAKKGGKPTGVTKTPAKPKANAKAKLALK